ncbi:MAG: primosomal protein N' [Armatimonadetes bacterium]|nr:primosomal protein N' [Armatimonadota bacterium]
MSQPTPPELALDFGPRPITCVDVALVGGPAALPEPLTYMVPAELRGQVRIGTAVRVPLGGRQCLGYVVAERETPPDPSPPLRPLRELVRGEPAFDARAVRVLRWLAETYACPLADAIPLLVPERQEARLETYVRLVEGWDGIPSGRAGPFTRATLSRAYRLLVEAGGELPRGELLARLGTPNAAPALSLARQKGWLAEETRLEAARVRARTVKGYVLIRCPTEAENQRLGEKQRAVLDHLAAAGERNAVPQHRLIEVAGAAADTLRRLERRGWLRPVAIPVRRVPMMGLAPDIPPALTAAQQRAVLAVEAAIRRGAGETLLLFGVTGSGKTEVYLRALAAARAAERTAILLVPEISLTSQIAEAVYRRLGDRVAILHSGLSEGERLDEWERLRRGEADVVVGPRSALFGPLRRPVLIVLDEEHDGAYKQDRAPRYHAREVARAWAREAGTTVLLGSATPALETFYAAEQGECRLLELPERIHTRPLPQVAVVDLREEARREPGVVFGATLREALRERVAAGEQAILFINRRGFSAFILCRDCGAVPRCPQCSVSLTLHRRFAGMLLCHHCGHARRAPDVCTACGGGRLRQFGIGSQRVEEAARQLLPEARVARLDRDTAARKHAPAQIIRAFRDREIDILVGTQMVTKGFDFPGVTLVGVVTADIALHLPDFRAAERAFQLLTQVSGRAGRGEEPGQVVVQTFNTEHPSIQAAAQHDYRAFYEREREERRGLGFPPFGRLARLLAAQAEEAAAEGRARAAAALLRGPATARGIEVLGPAPAPLARLQNRYRWQLLLRGPLGSAVPDFLRDMLPALRQRAGGVAVDVDPVDLL